MSSRSKRALSWLLKLRGSPRAIARGVAIGVFVALTPTLGLQSGIALFLATVLNANRPAALLLVWITNPLTMTPIFALTYWVGGLLWAGPPPGNAMARLERIGETLDGSGLLAVREALEALAAIGADVLIPMWIGGTLIGLICAAVSYAIALRLIEAQRRRRGVRRLRRKRRRRRRRADRQHGAEEI